MPQAQHYYSPEELAELLNIPLRTIYAWRHRGSGPPVLKVGRHLRYPSDQVDKWLQSLAQPNSAV